MFNFFENLAVKGHLQIAKLYPTGIEEIIFDDHNIIVSGFGVNLAHLFALSGSNKIYDYQIDRFQIGVHGSSVLEVSTTYQLSSPLSTIAQYTGSNGEILVVSAHQLKAGSVITTPQYFAKIPFNKVTKIDEGTVRYTIVIDQESCNGLSIGSTELSLNEIGLFAKNPQGRAIDASILVAYRVFSNIRKTPDFGLVFRWTINLK